MEAGDYLTTINELDIYRRSGGGEGLILKSKDGVTLIRDLGDLNWFSASLPGAVNIYLGLLL